ncbi:MAG: hypothetical protein U0Q03_10805 [Acidimicrobiales bacterium]
MHAPAKSPVLWIARALWLVVAVLGGSGFGDAFAPHGRAVQLTGTTVLWVGWGVVAVVLSLPSALGLTLTRMLVPMGVVAAVAAAIEAGVTTGTVLAIASTALAALVVASGEYGQEMVQASAYGDEWRFVLRPPAAFLVPSAVSWAVLCAATLSGPLLLAARSWVLGVPVTLAAVALGWLLLPRFHRLSRRWIVLVPAGFVLHDHVVLAETVMLRSAQVSRAHLALAGTEALDLTGPAGGHAVEVGLGEAATVVLAGTRAKPGGTAVHVLSFLCAPSRPGKLLRAAGDRKLPVG